MGEQQAWPEQEARRQEILWAAAQVFAAKGFHAARMEEVAERAGVAKGTVYLYYPSKEALFLATLEAILTQWLDELERAAAGPGTAGERVCSLLEANFTLANRHASLICLAAQESEAWCLRAQVNEAEKERMRAFVVRLARGVQKVLQEGIQAGELRPDLDVEAAVAMVLGTMHAYNIRRLHQREDLPAQELARRVADLLLAGMKG